MIAYDLSDGWGSLALEVSGVEVRVDLGRAQVAAAEQLLNVADAGAVTQEVRRAAVAEGVDVGFYLGGVGVGFDALLDHHVRERVSR